MELDKLEAMDFIKVVGKDLRGRHVLLMVASNLVVRYIVFCKSLSICIHSSGMLFYLCCSVFR